MKGLTNSRADRRAAAWLGAFLPRAVIPLLFLRLALPLAARAQAGPLTVQPVIEALRAHNDSRALVLCQELTRSQPRDPRLWTLEGMALEDLGRNQEGLRSLERALEIAPDYVPALEGAAQMQFRADMPKAQPYLERLIRLDPNNETAHAMLAALAFRQKNCQAAAAHFEKSRSVISGNLSALDEFGACLVRMGRPAEATPVFRRILELRPGDWKSRYNLGLVEFRAHQDREAVQTLLPLTEAASANVAALNLIAAAYEADGQTPQAVAALRRGVALAPRDADNYLDLATICLDHGSFQVGVDILKAGLRALPDSAPLYLELGVLLVQTGRFEEADADFRKAAGLLPAQNYSTVALGISLLQENKPGESLRLVRQRLTGAPNDPILNYLLAEILIRQGIQPGTPAFEEAVTAAQRSVRNKSDFAPAEDVLADLYLRAGQISEAAEASHRALEADPTDQSGIYHLVICARKEDDRRQASQLAEKLARVSAAAQKRDAARNRFRLVEETPGPSLSKSAN